MSSTTYSNNLTLVIPSHRNAEYLRLCYTSIREAHPTIPLIIMNDGGCPITQVFLESLNDSNLITQTYPTRVGHTLLYDVGFKLATTEYIGIMHADMVVPQNFFDLLLPRLEPRKVISARCVEPPLHPPGKEKIVMDFGMDAASFNMERFNQFAITQSLGTLPALFAPWFIHREHYFGLVGGHDIQFTPYGWEDADLFVRMMRNGFTPVQYTDLLVYHFTQRGHRWKDGQVGTEQDGYRLQMHLMQNTFAEKWGTLQWKDENHTPLALPYFSKKQLTVKNFTHPNRHKYEIIQVFFNEVFADDGQPIKVTGAPDTPNYILTIDYALEYDVTELLQFIQQLPTLVHGTDASTYEVGEMTLEVF
jgi:glycosyltransferase involved in cell wall biosynthesis